MKNKPLVSVFIPYYNDQEYLKDSIESVLNQSYENWELNLCNHASTDKSREIAHSYKDERIKHVDMPKNYGAGGGLVFKTMLDVAKGKYVKPFCAVDFLYVDCLEKMVSFMEENPSVTIGVPVKHTYLESRKNKDGSYKIIPWHHPVYNFIDNNLLGNVGNIF